jgi:hypothetical protein
MTDPLETLIRQAGEISTSELDLVGLRAQLGHRRRWRFRRRAVATALVVMLVGIGVAFLAVPGSPGPARITTLDGQRLSWTRRDGIPGAAQVTRIVAGPDGSIAIGTETQNHQSGIWYAPDGASWRLVYTELRQSAFTNALATSHGYVVTGFTNVTGRAGPVTIASVWVSNNGGNWERVDPSLEDAAPGIPSGGVESAIYDLTEVHGSLIGVGELYTHSRAPDGGQPCVWTSPDGIQWTHHVVNLGTGFDPFINRVTAHGGVIVAGGRSGKYPAVVWTTRDLRHWTPTTLAPQGAVQDLVATSRGFVAAGVIRTTNQASVGGALAVWSSPDGHQWRETLRLQPAAEAQFVGLATRGDTIVAVGRRGTDTTGHVIVFTSFAYGTADGSTWTRTDRPGATFPADSFFSGAGTTHNGFTIAGSAANGAPTPTNVIWQTNP